MKETLPPQTDQPASRTRTLLQSGVIFSIISFLPSLINFAFQGMISRAFAGHSGEFGLANNANSFVNFLGIPLTIAVMAITHYIANFRGKDDQVRLRGLLLGCRKVLLWFTVGGSIFALALANPLSRFFHFPRTSLVLVVMVCVVTGLWASFATALCQGLSWFKRLAVIGFVSALIRCVFLALVGRAHPVAEVAVASGAVAVLANVVLLYWRKEIFQHGHAESPWDREFVIYLVLSAACVCGNTFFLQMDPLVAQKYFSLENIDHYSTANKLATVVTALVSPLLAVLFTSRSGETSGDAHSAQVRLLALYAVGLVIGVAGLLIFRNLGVRLLRGTPSPESEAMIARVAVTMAFGGLMQAMAMWALASRWLKVSFLYGGLGLVYYLILLACGDTPDQLLFYMPLVSGAALVIMSIFWFTAMQQNRPAPAIA